MATAWLSQPINPRSAGPGVSAIAFGQGDDRRARRDAGPLHADIDLDDDRQR